MKAVVVYESHWGNTAAIAQAIADGIGSGTRALNTDEASREALAGVDLIVAGSPVIAFALPRDGSLNQIAKDEKAPVPPDTSHPLLRTWLHNLPVGRGFAAAFETRIWWSLRGATGTIESKLRESGYERLLPGERRRVGPSRHKRRPPASAPCDARRRDPRRVPPDRVRWRWGRFARCPGGRRG